MLIVQITVYASLVAVRVENTVITESQSVRFYADAVFYEESGVQHIYFHGGIAEYAPFHGETFKFAIEMHITAGTSVKLRCDTAHKVFYELQIGIVGFNLQVERALWFYGIYVAVYMALGNVFLADMGIKIDTFHFMMPFSVNIGIPQQAVIQSETSDEKIGVHDGLLQYSAGIGRTGSFALEVDSKIGNVEHVTYIDVF